MQERHCLHKATPQFEYENVGTSRFKYGNVETSRFEYGNVGTSRFEYGNVGMRLFAAGNMATSWFVDGNVGKWEHAPPTFCIHFAICYDFPDWMVGDNDSKMLGDVSLCEKGLRD